MALTAVVITWALCTIVDEWREAGWQDEQTVRVEVVIFIRDDIDLPGVK